MYTTYPQNQNYGPQHTGYGYAPMPQQPMPMPPGHAGSSTNTGLLMIAGLAVVGAAAFGGVYLMNTSLQPTAAPHLDRRQHPLGSHPSLTTDDDPASPVIVNNPAPSVRCSPPPPRQVGTPAPVQARPGQSQTPFRPDPARPDPGRLTSPTTKETQEREPKKKT